MSLSIPYLAWLILDQQEEEEEEEEEENISHQTI